MFHTRLTTRGSVLATLAVCTLIVGLLFRQDGIAFASLTMLLWLSLEWIGFQWLLLSNRGALQNCRRTINGQSDETITLSVDQQYAIGLSVTTPKNASGFRYWIGDTVPDALRVVNGATEVIVDPSGDQQIELRYEIRSGACGKMHLPGLRVMVSDSTGFFRHEQFIPVNQQLTVLPFLIRPQTTVSVLKRDNVQRLTGHHRYRRAGLGAELLGIRDYQPGDPPRMIAWKPTARLGKLMTCEFESEVPIRATIMVDLGSHQFIGRPGTAVADRVVSATASIAKLLLSDRDPVAAVMISERGSTRIPHGFGERQLTRLLQFMMSASDPNPSVEHLPISNLVDLIYSNAWQRFPQLFDDRLNRGSVRAAQWKRRRRVDARKRSKLAIVIGQLLQLDPGISRRLRFDDDLMRDVCRLYVDQYSLVSVPTTQQLGLQRVQRSHKKTMSEICRRLMEAHARAKDNELIVLVGRMPTVGTEMKHLEDVIRLIRAAHHRVVLVDAGSDNVTDVITDPTARRIMLESIIEREEIASKRLTSRLTALGVKLALIDDPKLIEKVAMEIELVRSGRIRTRSAR